MKKSLMFLIIILVSFDFANSQIKVWNKEFKSKKAKGIYSKLETPLLTKIPKNQNGSAFIGPFTIAATYIPYVIKYGNYVLKKATSKDEADYKFENTCLNQQLFSFDSLNDNLVNITAQQLFYEKGKNIIPVTLSKYSFSFKKDNSYLEISLDKIIEDYSSVKMKREYDFLISSFDISISALITEKVDSVTSIQKILDLGTTTIYKINPSFKSSNAEILNKAGIFFPSVTEKGKKIDVEQLIIKISIKHVNPFGITSNNLNDFLEKNSDTNEELLKSILLKKGDDKEDKN